VLIAILPFAVIMASAGRRCASGSAAFLTTSPQCPDISRTLNDLGSVIGDNYAAKIIDKLKDLNTVEINSSMKVASMTLTLKTVSNLVSALLGPDSRNWTWGKITDLSSNSITITPLPHSGSQVGEVTACGWRVTVALRPSASSRYPKPTLSIRFADADVDVALTVNEIEVSMIVNGQIAASQSCFHVDPDSVRAAVKVSDVTVKGESESAWKSIWNDVVGLSAAELLSALRTYLGVDDASILSTVATQKLRSALLPVATRYLSGFDVLGKQCTYQRGNACVRKSQPCGPGFVSLKTCRGQLGPCCTRCEDSNARPCAALFMCDEFANDCPRWPKYEKVLGPDGDYVPCTKMVSGKRTTGTLCRLSSACLPESGVCQDNAPRVCTGSAVDRTSGIKTIFNALAPRNSIPSALNKSLRGLSPLSTSIQGVPVTLSPPQFTSTFDSSMIDLVCAGTNATTGVCETYVTLSGLQVTVPASVGGDACQPPLSISFDATVAVLPFVGEIVIDMSRSCIYGDSVVVSTGTGSKCDTGSSSSDANRCNQVACFLQQASRLVVPQLLNTLLRKTKPVRIPLTSLSNYESTILTILRSLC